MYNTTVVARGCLNIIRNFGSHGHLPWIEIAQFCKLLHLIAYMDAYLGVGACPEHYGS